MLRQSKKDPESRFVTYDCEDERSRWHGPSEYDMKHRGEDKRESKVKVQIIHDLSEMRLPRKIDKLVMRFL